MVLEMYTFTAYGSTGGLHGLQIKLVNIGKGYPIGWFAVHFMDSAAVSNGGRVVKTVLLLLTKAHCAF